MDERARLASRFFDAIERYDIETVGRCYAPNARIWHSFDNRSQTREENLQGLGRSIANMSNRSFKEVRIELFQDGFVRQHVLTGNKADGAPVSIPICVVCRLEHGQIAQLDEYVDLAQVAALRGEGA